MPLLCTSATIVFFSSDNYWNMWAYQHNQCIHSRLTTTMVCIHLSLCTPVSPLACKTHMRCIMHTLSTWAITINMTWLFNISLSFWQTETTGLFHIYISMLHIVSVHSLSASWKFGVRDALSIKQTTFNVACTCRHAEAQTLEMYVYALPFNQCRSVKSTSITVQP